MPNFAAIWCRRCRRKSEAPAPAATAHVGQMLRDASGGRIGAVTEVYKDGSVQVIYNSQLVTIPAASLATTDGKLTSSLTRKQLSQL